VRTKLWFGAGRIWCGAASPPVRRWPAYQHGGRDRHWTVCRWGWQFSGTQEVDEAYVPFFGAFGADWDNSVALRWSASPLGMLWPEMDVAVMSAGGGGLTATTRRPIIIIAASAKARAEPRWARPAVLGRPSLPAVGHAPWGRFWPGVLPGAGGLAAGSDGCSSPAEASGAAADPNHHEPYSPLHQHPASALVLG
jgi:hypothetical protein